MAMEDSPSQGAEFDLTTLHRISLELVRETSLDRALAQVAAVAAQLAGARQCAVGLLAARGGWEQWGSSGAGLDEIRAQLTPHAWDNFVIGVIQAGASLRRPENSAEAADGVALMGVPVRSQAGILGVIVLTGKAGGGAFSVADQQIIEILAAFSTIAIENARSRARLQADEDELAQRNRELSIFNDVSVAASTTLELEGILATTLDRMMMHFNAPGGEIFLAEEDGGRLRIALRRGNPPASYWDTDSFAVGEGFVGRVAAAKDLLAAADPAPEAGFDNSLFAEAGLRMLLGIPLISKGRVLGVMILALRRPVDLSARQKALFEAVGLSVGTAVENGLLHRTSQRLAVFEERERIGMDLHDGIIQSIYAVGLLLEEGLLELEKTPAGTKPKLERAIAGLNAVIRDIRAYINNLQPQRFIFDNLAVGLDLLLREFLVNTPVTAEAELSQEAARGLAPATASALFHIAQEALANVTRHARASKVRMILEQVEDRVVLEVADNGQGFDPARRATFTGHGLANMEERARAVRGELAVVSRPGGGTVVRASIPRIRPQTGNLAGKITRGTGPFRRG
jgi:two-component system sensor histidine kinase DevS